MSKQVPWCKLYVERFIDLAMLNETEQKIIRTRVAGWSRTAQANELNISLATLDRLIANLKTKYDEVQKHDDILPKRMV